MRMFSNVIITVKFDPKVPLLSVSYCFIYHFPLRGMKLICQPPEEKESGVTLMYCVGMTSVTRQLPLSLFAG